jgi:hypothetical protein
LLFELKSTIIEISGCFLSIDSSLLLLSHFPGIAASKPAKPTLRCERRFPISSNNQSSPFDLCPYYVFVPFRHYIMHEMTLVSPLWRKLSSRKYAAGCQSIQVRCALITLCCIIVGSRQGIAWKETDRISYLEGREGYRGRCDEYGTEMNRRQHMI